MQESKARKLSPDAAKTYETRSRKRSSSPLSRNSAGGKKAKRHPSIDPKNVLREHPWLNPHIPAQDLIKGGRTRLQAKQMAAALANGTHLPGVIQRKATLPDIPADSQPGPGTQNVSEEIPVTGGRIAVQAIQGATSKSPDTSEAEDDPPEIPERASSEGSNASVGRTGATATTAGVSQQTPRKKSTQYAPGARKRGRSAYRIKRAKHFRICRSKIGKDYCNHAFTRGENLKTHFKAIHGLESLDVRNMNTAIRERSRYPEYYGPDGKAHIGPTARNIIIKEEHIFRIKDCIKT